jgi:hypothetical protein
VSSVVNPSSGDSSSLPSRKVHVSGVSQDSAADLAESPKIPRNTGLVASGRPVTPDFLWHGAEAYGFRGEVWTCTRVAQVIEWEFGIRYHKDHVSRLLKDLGWTPQIPITRAVQRDEAAIARWRIEV